MLFQYMRRTQRILRDQRVQLMNPHDLIDYINEARGQLAGESECILFMGSLSIVVGQNAYPFSAITLTGSSGIAGILSVRTLWTLVASGQRWLRPRPWPWFSLFELSNPTPTTGPPQVWAQFTQGVNGSIYLSPTPDYTYTVQADCVCYPTPLAADTDAEAIPYLWTDAVPYYAAYLAMLAMQSGGQTAEADNMFRRYQTYVGRARVAATPSVLPTIYQGIPSPVRHNQLGISGDRQGNS